jgi:multicomponent Na+:H+ antiporter subunit C
MIYSLSLLLILIGLYGIICKKNVVKIILGIIIMEYGINLFILLLGWRKEAVAPILDISRNSVADPVPQAMVLTVIAAGLGLVSLMVALAIRLYEQYGTFDTTKMKEEE